MSTTNQAPNKISSISTPQIIASDTTPLEFSEDSIPPQENSNKYKFAGPYEWVLWTEDGALTSARVVDRDADSEEDAKHISGDRFFGRKVPDMSDNADEMRCVLDRLEKKCDWMKKGVREMGKTIREREEKKKNAVLKDESKGVDKVVK